MTEQSETEIRSQDIKDLTSPKKENSGDTYGSFQEKKIITFLSGLPKRKELREENTLYAKREEYWINVTKKLRESSERGKIKDFDKIIGRLIAWKEYSGSYDALTGLSTKRIFNQNLKREISRAEREKSPLSLLVIDIDDMKSFNDEDKSHFTGDRAIKNTAKTLIGETREGDFVARWAGDEFTAILPNAEEKDALEVAQRILKKIKEVPSFVLSGKKLSVSIGVRQWQGENSKDFFEKTDKVLYEAKKSPDKIAIAR
ncbi:MAG: GGDEF domain-containing protein [Candidatus Shapirobacteria bacterium]|nr:GGDEF domain-containing protein [Candidatus Shapirobacteria bacterium]